MSMYYSDPKRKNDKHALPDVEVFYADDLECENCEGAGIVDYGAGERECEDCGGRGTREAGWYYWYCFPGCLPEGDAIGPFASEREAAREMREDAGLGE
jgi:hypothetical protein